MEAVTRIVFVDDSREKFFGEGPYRLLLAVEQTGSLHGAAGSMGMAYSKAMKLIRRAESVLGFPLTMRTAGGASGGGSRLTDGAREFMQTYEQYRDACYRENQRIFQEI